ncbi:MAG: hypothetical protein ACFE95_06660 [Candidatus Hodarchaeota archaeon]
MSKNQFQETIRKLKEAEKLNKLGKKEWEEELRKQEEIESQVELEYERRKKEAAKQLKEGMKLLKKEKKSD